MSAGFCELCGSGCSPYEDRCPDCINSYGGGTLSGERIIMDGLPDMDHSLVTFSPEAIAAYARLMQAAAEWGYSVELDEEPY